MSGCVFVKPSQSIEDAVAAPDVPAPCTALLCEGFEGAFIDTWSMDVSGGTAAVDQLLPHTGRFALHSINPGQAMVRAQLANAKTLANITTASIRVWVYFPSGYAVDAAIMELVSPSNDALYLRTKGDQYQLEGTGAFMSSFASFASFELGTWTCLRLEITYDTTTVTNTITIYHNAAVLDTRTGFAPTTMLSELRLGLFINGTQTTPLTDVWYDDVVIDNKPTECP
jgi:hypothetical protein